MANKDILRGYRCPRCGSDGPFFIKGRISLTVTDKKIELHEDSLAFSRSSPCKCLKCNLSRWLKDFDIHKIN